MWRSAVSWRTLALAFVLASLAPARAQIGSPAVASLVLPLRVATMLRSDVDRWSGGAHESVRASARVRLAIEADGEARLTLDGHRATTLGAARGLEHRSEHDHVTWIGHAIVSGARTTIVFAHEDRSAPRLALYGQGPRGPTPPPGGPMWLSCSVGSVAVWPATPELDERSARIPLLLCSWADPPSAFEPYGDRSAWALGAGTGVHDSVAWIGRAPTTRHVVRLAP